MERSTCERLSPGRLWWRLMLTIVIAVIIVIAALPRMASAQPSVPSASVTLPDLFRSQQGTPIGSVGAWYKVRRPEPLRWFTEEMYGRSPGKPRDLRFRVFDEDPHALDGSATRRQVAVYFQGSDSPRMDILLYIPNGVQGSVPVFLGLNFSGNQTICADTAILPPLFSAGALASTSAAPRGSARDRWPLKMILATGYAVATVYAGDIAPDRTDGFHAGVQALYPGLQRGGDNFGTLSAWAWGLGRVMDYFETDRAIDARAVVVFGWSRMGKAALWAGAQDSRFAAVISNESGADGAKLFHHFAGENTHRLCTKFPYWFCHDFQRFDGKDTGLPFDQHELVALIAPRPLYIASAEEDLNSDPVGECMTARAVDTVYRFLGVGGLPVTTTAPVNHPELGRISYHVRSGKHSIIPYDWTQYLRFWDRYVKGHPKR